MVLRNFPRDVSQSSGLFWAIGTEDPIKVPGFCRVDGASIEIEATDPLTPAFDSSDGPRMRRADELDDLVVHGNTNLPPYKLTFLGTHTTARERVLLPFVTSFIATDDEAPQTHRLQADWIISGAHVPSPTSAFTAIRARFSHLERWAKFDGIDWDIAPEPGTDAVLRYSRPDDITVPFTQYSENAMLRLRNEGACSPLKNGSARISSKSWLELEGISGWTLDEALARFINPIRALMAILAGEAADVLEVEVLVDDRWCTVFGGQIKRCLEPDNGSGESMLLSRGTFPLESISAWCGTTALLSPVPYVVEAALSKVLSTVEVEALQLSTSAEGMDNVLHPDSRRFSEEEVEEAKKSLKQSDMPERVRNALTSELGAYLFKTSYPTRMKRTAEEVARVAPDCVGNPTKWKNAMRDLRNDLAHANFGSDDLTDELIRAIHARSRSLRWALQIRLLQHAGASEDHLQSALQQSRRFGRDVKLWKGMFGPAITDED